jgi:hypothetical protein
MEFIQQKREAALLENTAQNTLFDFLEKLLPTSTEIRVDVPLFGDVDLEILQKCNFKDVDRLLFSAGSITSIKNVPKLKELRVAKNLLLSIPEMKHVEIVDLAENGIKQADLSAAVDLKELYLSRNPLVEITALPSSLEVLQVEYCRLTALHLSGGLDHLRTVHCSGNPGLVVHNLPESVKDFHMDPTAELMDEVRERTRQNLGNTRVNVDYADCLKAYFQKKRAYEHEARMQRTRLFERVQRNPRTYKALLEKMKPPPCVVCKQAGGMKFSCADRTYEAKCMAKNPCTFHIKFYAGIFDNLSDTIETLRDGTEEKREKIIKLKMDSLFNYLSEEATAKLFKQAYTEYQTSANMATTYKKIYDDLHFSEERETKIAELTYKIATIKQEIETKRKELTEGTTDLSVATNHAIYKDMIAIHQKELAVEIQNLRRLKFPSMHIYQPNENEEYYVLDQQRTTFADMDFTMDEPPRVIVFEK